MVKCIVLRDVCHPFFHEEVTNMTPPTPLPLVSVLIVNYNSGRYAAKAIKSLLRQKNIELDIIVVDNASQDDSLVKLDAVKALGLQRQLVADVVRAEDGLEVHPLALDEHPHLWRGKNEGSRVG